MKQETLWPDIVPEQLETEEGKVCSKCNKWKPLYAYPVANGGNYLRPDCKECLSSESKIRAELKRIHGQPPEDYECPICLITHEELQKFYGVDKTWALDHCHDTKEFRGWLCHKCNRSLGNFKDSVERLQRAIEYLERHERTRT